MYHEEYMRELLENLILQKILVDIGYPHDFVKN